MFPVCIRYKVSGNPLRYIPETTIILIFIVMAFELAPLYLAAVAFISQYLGLTMERWYFFTEEKHPQNLYYQTAAWYWDFTILSTFINLTFLFKVNSCFGNGALLLSRNQQKLKFYELRGGINLLIIGDGDMALDKLSSQDIEEMRKMRRVDVLSIARRTFSWC